MPSQPVMEPAALSTVPTRLDLDGGPESEDDCAAFISCTASSLVCSPLEYPNAEDTAPWTYCGCELCMVSEGGW